MNWQTLSRLMAPAASQHPCIVVRGGATSIFHNHISIMTTLKKTAREGYEMLRYKIPAAEVIEDTIKILETDPDFNCGLGSHRNHSENIENHSGIMHGGKYTVGCVSNIDSTRHPISVAKAIMEYGRGACFLAGQGAQSFAEKHEVPKILRDDKLEESNTKRNHNGGCDPSNFDTKQLLQTAFIGQRFSKDDQEDDSTAACGSSSDIYNNFTGGVGVLARDIYGNIAAGSSSGGCFNRIESCICGEHLIGCGLYADNTRGAISISGVSQLLIKYCIASRLLECKDSTDFWNTLHNLSHNSRSPLGVIYMHRNGNMGIYTMKGQMPWFAVRGLDEIQGDFEAGFYESKSK